MERGHDHARVYSGALGAAEHHMSHEQGRQRAVHMPYPQIYADTHDVPTYRPNYSGSASGSMQHNNTGAALHAKRLLEALANHKAAQGPLLEEQSTITESCSWTGSVCTARSTLLPEMSYSTPTSPEPLLPHAQQPRWLRSVFKLAAPKAWRAGSQSAGLTDDAQWVQQGLAQPVQQQTPALLQQQTLDGQKQWWKPRRKTQSDSMGPASCHGGAVDLGTQQCSIAQPNAAGAQMSRPLSNSKQRLQQYHGEVQQQQQQQQQHYQQESHQERLQRLRQLQAPKQQQQQPAQPTGSMGPFAQQPVQQAVLPSLLHSSKAGSSKAAMSQVVESTTGQVLKVTPDEFQDILTVMRALADARKSLAVELHPPADSTDSLEGATAGSAAAAAASGDRVAAQQHPQSNAALQRGEPSCRQPATQQDGQQGLQMSRPSQLHVAPAAADQRPAAEVDIAGDSGYQVYSCTAEGVMPGRTAGVNNDASALAPEASNWQQQQQQHNAAPLSAPSPTKQQTAAEAAAFEAEELQGPLMEPSFAADASTEEDSLQEPDTPLSMASIKVHASVSCAGEKSPFAGRPLSQLPPTLEALTEQESSVSHLLPASTESEEGSGGGEAAMSDISTAQQSPQAGSGARHLEEAPDSQDHMAGGPGPKTNAGKPSNNSSSSSSSGSGSGSSGSSNELPQQEETLTQEQLEQYHTGWTDDESPRPEDLQEPLRVRQKHQIKAQKRQELPQLRGQGGAGPDVGQLKQLYQKVSDLESGLQKLLNGSTITPAAAAALIASLNKLTETGEAASLGSADSQAFPGSSESKLADASQAGLLESIRSAAMAAASAGGAPEFASREALLQAAASVGNAVQQESSRSSIVGAHTQSSTSSKQAGTDGGSVSNVASKKERQSSAASQLQSSSQQQQDASVQPGSSTGHVATDGVAVAMQVLAKAEEKLHELQLHEARLKAFWAAREAGKPVPPMLNASMRRKSSLQPPATILEGDEEQVLQDRTAGSASRLGSAVRRHGKEAPLRTPRRPLLGVESPRHRAGRCRAAAPEVSAETARLLLSPRHTAESSDEQVARQEVAERGLQGRMPMRSVEHDMGPCRSYEIVARSDAFAAGSSGGGASCYSGSYSDDSGPLRRDVRRSQRHRLQLKLQRSAGGNGSGYESADEAVSYGGASLDSEAGDHDERGRAFSPRLCRRSSSVDRSFTSRHSMLHTAPVGSLHASQSRRQVLLSTGGVLPEVLERGLEQAAAKAAAKARSSSSTVRPFKARDVPAHVYENRYSTMMANSKLGSHRAQLAASCRPGGYAAAKGLSQPAGAVAASSRTSSSNAYTSATGGSISRGRGSGAVSAVPALHGTMVSSRRLSTPDPAMERSSRMSASELSPERSRRMSSSELALERSHRMNSPSPERSRRQQQPGVLSTVMETRSYSISSAPTMSSSLYRGQAGKPQMQGGAGGYAQRALRSGLIQSGRSASPPRAVGSSSSPAMQGKSRGGDDGYLQYLYSLRDACQSGDKAYCSPGERPGRSRSPHSSRPQSCPPGRFLSPEPSRSNLERPGHVTRPATACAFNSDYAGRHAGPGSGGLQGPLAERSQLAGLQTNMRYDRSPGRLRGTTRRDSIDRDGVSTADELVRRELQYCSSRAASPGGRMYRHCIDEDGRY